MPSLGNARGHAMAQCRPDPWLHRDQTQPPYQNSLQIACLPVAEVRFGEDGGHRRIVTEDKRGDDDAGNQRVVRFGEPT